MKNMEAAGPVPDFVKDASADGSGRYCVAAFHQLHCLVSHDSSFCLQSSMHVHYYHFIHNQIVSDEQRVQSCSERKYTKS